MKKIDINSINENSKKQRFCISEIKDFLDNHKEKYGDYYDDEDRFQYGQILVLNGLYGTGKTTIMRQIITEYKNKPEYKDKCAFYEIEENDSMNDIFIELYNEIKKYDLKLICLDGITNSKDLAEDSEFLATVFATNGVQIIVTGDENYGFHLADEKELRYKHYSIRTNYISYAEYSYLTGNTDIFNYIKYGGLLTDKSSKNIIYDYKSAQQYIYKYVMENLVNSSNKDCFRTSEYIDMIK